MRTRKRGTEALVMIACAFAAPARAQHIVGGGDPLMLLVGEARTEAVAMLDQLADAGAPAGIDDAVAAFLRRTADYGGAPLPMPRAMARELERARFSWRADDAAGLDKCAAIELSPEDYPDIYLSLPRCRSLLALSPAAAALAAQTLIHESAHRFGLSRADADEDLASRLGTAVVNVWKARRAAAPMAWADTAFAGEPSPRAFASHVWTGAGHGVAGANQVLIWGGCDGSLIPGTANCDHYPREGGRLEFLPGGTLGEPPSTRWLPLDAAGAPPGRKLHTAVFTGDATVAAAARKMIVFGGCSGPDTACSQSYAVAGAQIYDLAADRWTPLADGGAPSPRVAHTAVWTADDEMIVFGGLEGFQNPAPDRALGDGGILAFADDHPAGAWRPLPVTANAPAPRFGHAAVWTDRGMLVWGGCAQTSANPASRCARPLNDGAVFDPHAAAGQDPWTRLPPVPFLRGRVGMSAVWTGRYLLVWGGDDKGDILSDGARYDSVAGTWTPLSPNLPAAERKGRRDHTAAYEPLRGRMIVWGGTDGVNYPDRTWIYGIESNSWSEAGAADPAGRVGQVGAWIQDSLLVWGGFNGQNGFLGHGGLFNP